MRIALPLYKQEKDNTCALACLRMALAAFGTNVEERALEAEATMHERGTLIDGLERLARRFGLVAEIQEATVEDLRRLLAGGRVPIAYLDRAVFELTPRQRAKHSLRDAQIHTVIPTRVTAASVTYHDPLGPRVTRRTVGLFRYAYERLGGLCVVCAKREEGRRRCRPARAARGGSARVRPSCHGRIGPGHRRRFDPTMPGTDDPAPGGHCPCSSSVERERDPPRCTTSTCGQGRHAIRNASGSRSATEAGDQSDTTKLAQWCSFTTTVKSSVSWLAGTA